MFWDMLQPFLESTGFAALSPQAAIMLVVALVVLYLGIRKGFEPLLLIPIGFGILLANIPLTGITEECGLLYFLHQGIGLYPPLIFLGVGALTDFGPLIANPRSMLLGAAAQLGIFGAFLGAVLLRFSLPEAASIGIIGGADGPTAIFLTSKLAPGLLAPIAVAAYSYMALVPIIQPPIARLLTTERERKIVMEQLRPVSKTERILFPIVVTLVGTLDRKSTR